MEIMLDSTNRTAGAASDHWDYQYDQTSGDEIFMYRKLLIGIAILLFVASGLLQGETWKIDPAHSAVQFSVRHLEISTVRGEFRKVSGTVAYDAADPSKTSIDVSIDTASVDTRVEMRDNDLRSPNFLDVQRYPTITFKSKHVDAAGPGKLKIAGDLTIHGVTKEVVLDVDGLTAPITAMGGSRIGASATTKINRKDFGVNGAPAMVGDEISITLDVEVTKPAAAH
jgi:polyisoprenoid-binding protein YceI